MKLSAPGMESRSTPQRCPSRRPARSPPGSSPDLHRRAALEEQEPGDETAVFENALRKGHPDHLQGRASLAPPLELAIVERLIAFESRRPRLERRVSRAKARRDVELHGRVNGIEPGQGL